MRRPFGVTLLGFVYLANALNVFAVVLGLLFAPHLLSSVLAWFDKSAASFKADDLGMAPPVFYSALACALGALYVIFARGLWRLKNWARVICIFFAIADLGLADGDSLRPLPQLLSQKAAPLFWPHSDFVTSGILGTLLNFVAAVLVLAYLLKAPIKQAFGANSAEWKWITGLAAFALLLFAHSLYKSKPEWEAIRWHARHGNQVVVNGVTFPVYYWHVPNLYDKDSGFSIDDYGSGPLRPNRTIFSLEVLGFRKEPTNLTVDQLVDGEIQSYEKAGYTKLDKFGLKIANETLGCMREHEFGAHGAVYCYGDGPIYTVFFAGGERSSKLFESMMSAAK